MSRRGPHLRALTAAIALALTPAPAGAQAAEPTPRSGEGRITKTSQPNLALGAEAVTDFPVLLGGRLWLELPGRLRLNTSLGVLPGAYSRVLGGLAESVGGVEDEEVDLVRDALSSSFIWRINAGWRPLPARGGYVDVGYTLATLGADLDAATVLSVSDVTVPAAFKAGDYAVRAHLHMVNLELGWMWDLFKGVTLRAALGATFIAGVDTTVSGGPPTPLGRQITASAEAFFDDAFTSLRVIPTFTLALGWHIWPFGGPG